eukprot:CAMPEP_0177374220 /NCGR_PEP_ID=MMETSP0368-20130122/44038_1 /TAXON_ID=447022 ORGANISM="Scrippsiella hangoei-like, Strain SHHI-4" /NCGR_SAMPLE_ID=MMETSP0368 /ASSEMBLY_ACC=CAM_ASM_000363 /LENGTH=177 /DNA_ID=CAMNT_0018837795 /DNA_START=58 /DNA_END=592 /DNA_ORIENTATION=+
MARRPGQALVVLASVPMLLTLLSLLSCPSPCMAVGGTGAAQAAGPEVQELVDGLREEALKRAQAAGWNGTFDRWEAKLVKTQVVAGTNYFVKVAVSDTDALHLRIYKPLPHTRLPPTLNGVKLGQDHQSPLEYFEPSDRELELPRVVDLLLRSAALRLLLRVHKMCYTDGRAWQTHM